MLSTRHQYCNANRDGDIFQPVFARITPFPLVSYAPPFPHSQFLTNPQTNSDKQQFVIIQGELKKRITKGAYAKITVKYGLIQLLSTTDVCEQLGNVDLSCPIEDGKWLLRRALVWVVFRQGHTFLLPMFTRMTTNRSLVWERMSISRSRAVWVSRRRWGLRFKRTKVLFLLGWSGWLYLPSEICGRKVKEMQF